VDRHGVGEIVEGETQEPAARVADLEVD